MSITETKKPIRDIERMRSDVFAWAQLAVAAIVIIAMAFLSVGCGS